MILPILLLISAVIFIHVMVISLYYATNRKGSFTVLGYKNGELVYKETYTDESFTVSPGDSYDKVEIID